MTARVVSLEPGDSVEAGGTLLVGGRAHLVLHRLPALPDRPLAVRATPDPPCRLCDARLRWPAEPMGGWYCRSCGDRPDRAALAAWAREHVGDGVRRGRNRRRLEGRQKATLRGAPSARELLLRAATEGGAESRSALLDQATGDARRALRWALRGHRAGGLVEALQCRNAADALALLLEGRQR